MSEVARFINYTDEEFIGKWDGHEQKFAAGQSKLMETWKAEHYAKHLTNRELQKEDENGESKAYLCSPKNPQDSPEYMAVFNKAIEYIDEEGDDSPAEIIANKEHGETTNEVSSEITSEEEFEGNKED